MVFVFSFFLYKSRTTKSHEIDEDNFFASCVFVDRLIWQGKSLKLEIRLRIDRCPFLLLNHPVRRLGNMYPALGGLGNVDFPEFPAGAAAQAVSRAFSASHSCSST
ncbi:MAG: hypothetical protein QOH42_910 [Blastocatellia bacterium]|nr:hypothetical protein [Blastocatellia bacterium]